MFEGRLRKSEVAEMQDRCEGSEVDGFKVRKDYIRVEKSEVMVAATERESLSGGSEI